MIKDDPIGSVHFAISNLASALHGISLNEELEYPLEIELGDDRIFVLHGGVVISQPNNFPHVSGIPSYERLVAGIKVRPYPSNEPSGGSSSKPEESKTAPSHTAGGDKTCPVCHGTGKVK